MLNKATVNRMISKQECTYLLLEQSLTECTEFIDSVSVSASTKFTLRKENGNKSNIVENYKKRPSEYDDWCLYEYFLFTRNGALSKNTKKHAAKLKDGQKLRVPHFVGGSTTSVFPPTKKFARTMLMLYKPWKTDPTMSDYVDVIREFNGFVESDLCPKRLHISYVRSVERKLDGTKFVEATATEGVYDMHMDEETAEYLNLTGYHFGDEEIADKPKMQYNYGLDYDWSVRHCEEISKTVDNSDISQP